MSESDESRFLLFSPFYDELRPAAAEYMLGEYSIHVATIVTVRHVVPRRFLSRLFHARRGYYFFDAGFTAIGTFWFCHETLTRD